VRDSHKLAIAELAQRIKALTKQAVDGNIAPDELSGATFTVSNLGVFGIESFSPILTPPQVAILGVNAIELKPVRREGGAIEFVDYVGLSLTCDHQVIDGASGARFLGVVREQIENIEALAALDI
jgi:pyruvate dehydrogenase E2 component (dihydrolipoamide acetyltransferase)